MINDVGVTCIRFCTGSHFKQIKLEKADLRLVPYWLEKIWSAAARPVWKPGEAGAACSRLTGCLTSVHKAHLGLWVFCLHTGGLQQETRHHDARHHRVLVGWLVWSFISFICLVIHSIFVPTPFTPSCLLAMTDDVPFPAARSWSPCWSRFLVCRSTPSRGDWVRGWTADPPQAPKRFR